MMTQTLTQSQGFVEEFDVIELEEKLAADRQKSSKTYIEKFLFNRHFPPKTRSMAGYSLLQKW